MYVVQMATSGENENSKYDGNPNGMPSMNDECKHYA